MTFVTVRLTTGALQERLNNRLIEVGQVTSDALVATEDRHIGQLRDMVFTEGVTDAIVQRDAVRLRELLLPYWATARLNTLIVLDTNDLPLVAWERDPASASAQPRDLQVTNLTSWWLVQQIRTNQQDVFGDKFSTFYDQQFYTAAPVRMQNRLVGAMLVGTPFTELLDELQRRSQASITTLYDEEGRAFATTQVVVADTVISAVPVDVLSALRANRSLSTDWHVQSTATLNGRDYQFAYSPLQVRRAMQGYYTVGLSRGFILDAWAQQRMPLLLLTFGMLFTVIMLGLVIAQHITRPLLDLVGTARAVASGDLLKRSSVTSRDELGVVAQAFNMMTERLLLLYETSQRFGTTRHVNAIIATLEDAVQPLVPGARVLAVLPEARGWRFEVGPNAAEAWAEIDQRTIDMLPPTLIDHEHIHTPLLIRADDPLVASLHLPPNIAEICLTALTVQEQFTGLLLIVHAEPHHFARSVLAPLATMARMAATALHNARLYQEVQDEAVRRRAILDSIAEGVVVCDAKGTVMLMNPAAEALLQLEDWPTRRYDFADLPLARLEDSHILQTNDEHAYTRYEAHGQVLRASRALLTAADRTLVGEVVVLHNISEEVALDRAKTDLIAIVAHELRTPLTAIQGAVDMLRQGTGGQLAPLHVELAQMAHRQSIAMSGVIDKAILVANIESGALKLANHPTNVGTVITTAATLLQPLADAEGSAVRVELAENLPIVQADPRILTIALQQVIDNAIRYGGQTVVEVHARASANGVEIQIRDQGPGIPADELPRLFHRLDRGMQHLNTQQRGLGLGLAIAHEVVVRHGGTISITSTVGQGTCCALFLPGTSYDEDHVAA